MICCVTGHRSQGFPFERDKNHEQYVNYIVTLYREIEKLIDEGYDHFISGMAEGADMDFADAVLFFQRDTKNDITLEAALPYPIHPKKKPSDYDIAKNLILMQCRQTILSPFYHRGCMEKRNRYMVDQSNIVLAIWNGKKQGGT
ncbi:MAG: DUF1273 family protein [Clostridia bacterium]|nr:DUF1273 family protein [Clostridia bacterium]